MDDSVSKRIQDLAGLDISDPEVQYKARSGYRDIVRDAVAQKIRWPLYDAWTTFLPYRQAAGRGFFLDLWDILALELKNKDVGSDYDDVHALLQAYICGIIDDFAAILGVS